jgi:hypothetical protein
LEKLITAVGEIFSYPLGTSIYCLPSQSFIILLVTENGISFEGRIASSSQRLKHCAESHGCVSELRFVRIKPT